MDDFVDFDDHWSALLASLPSEFDLDHMARSLGAFCRARQVKDSAALLRMALAYGGCGMSLRQTCAWAAETGLAEISDPALLKRLRNTQDWLAGLALTGLAQAMLNDRIAVQAPPPPSAAPALRGGRYDAVRTRCQGHQLAPACRLRFDGRSG